MALVGNVGKRIASNVLDEAKTVGTRVLDEAKTVGTQTAKRATQTGKTASSSGTMTSLENLMKNRKLTRGLMAGAMTTYGVHQFKEGFTSQTGDISDAFYETTTGNPNIDDEVFGTNYGMMDAMTPMLPRPGTMGSMKAGGAVGGLVGGIGGFALGSSLMKRVGGRGKIVSGLFGAATGMMGMGVGVGAGATAGVAGSLSPRERRLVFNPTMVSRGLTDQRAQINRNKYNTTGVEVNGDLVFGAYNFRGGSA